MISAYKKLLESEDASKRTLASRQWALFGHRIMSLRVPSDPISNEFIDAAILASARIETHFFVNGGFLPSDNYLLDHIFKIRHIPCVIIQGRYDIVCPMKSAWELHKAWPEAKFVVVPDAGHLSSEAGTISELIRATDNFRK